MKKKRDARVVIALILKFYELNFRKLLNKQKALRIYFDIQNLVKRLQDMTCLVKDVEVKKGKRR